MKNLAGLPTKEVDLNVLDELRTAGLYPLRVEQATGEVKYSYISRIGNWEFSRAHYYWIVKADKDTVGLPLDLAMELYHNKAIRAGGDCTSPSPDGYVAQPIYNEELFEKVQALGYELKYMEYMKQYYIPLNFGEIADLCNTGKLDVQRYVDVYHVDSQAGLTELVDVIKKHIVISIEKDRKSSISNLCIRRTFFREGDLVEKDNKVYMFVRNQKGTNIVILADPITLEEEPTELPIHFAKGFDPGMIHKSEV